MEAPPTGAGWGGAPRLPSQQGWDDVQHRTGAPTRPPTPDHQLESGRETTGRWRDRPRAAHVGVRV